MKNYILLRLILIPWLGVAWVCAQPDSTAPGGNAPPTPTPAALSDPPPIPVPVPSPALPPVQAAPGDTTSAASVYVLQAQHLQEVEEHWRDRLRGQERQMVLLVVLLLLVAPAAFAFGVAHARYRQQQEFQSKLRSLIEKGHPIPAELLAPPAGKPPISDLRKGVLLIVSGIGLMFFLGALLPAAGWSLGLIPFFLGVTYLVLRRIEPGRSED